MPGPCPRLAFNALATDWEQSEHNGLAMLLKGLFSTFRNPTAHAPRVAWATSREEALDMLTLSSMLHRRLDSATVRPPNAEGSRPEGAPEPTFGCGQHTGSTRDVHFSARESARGPASIEPPDRRFA